MVLKSSALINVQIFSISSLEICTIKFNLCDIFNDANLRRHSKFPTVLSALISELLTGAVYLKDPLTALINRFLYIHTHTSSYLQKEENCINKRFMVGLLLQYSLYHRWIHICCIRVYGGDNNIKHYLVINENMHCFSVNWLSHYFPLQDVFLCEYKLTIQTIFFKVCWRFLIFEYGDFQVVILSS